MLLICNGYMGKLDSDPGLLIDTRVGRNFPAGRNSPVNLHCVWIEPGETGSHRDETYPGQKHMAHTVLGF